MSESSAAAMSYGLLVAGRKTVAVFDMGGGTTDVTIIAIHEGSSRVLATAGNGGCGGRDYDRAVLRHLLSRFLEESGALKCSIESTNARMETLLSKLQANHQDLYESLLVLCSHAKVIFLYVCKPLFVSHIYHINLYLIRKRLASLMTRLLPFRPPPILHF